MRLHIAVIAGPHQGQVFTFTGHDTFLVGRSKRAHFRLPEKDEYFSRLHFLVEVNPPRCQLLDMKSTNGTFVNGRKVAVADLADGDLIQGGQTVLRVALEEDSEAVTRQTPGEVVPAPQAAAEAAPGVLTQPHLVGAPAIPGYQLVRELGRGGMGVVYLARRAADGAVVALKTIKPAADVSRQEVDRFLREADILRQLDHPHIVAFRDLGEAGGQLYFAMDYVPGRDAAALLKEQEPWPVARAVGLVCQVLEALNHAHGRGFVHRDVKPANLLVTAVDGREEGKVVDFGLARVYQASKLSGLTLAGQVGGTAPFMAPEQIVNFRESKPAVDQYAAAATLYNLLTGKYVHDFPAAFQERLLLILQQPAVPIQSRRADMPARLAAVIHRGLEKEPADRFADVRQMRQALLDGVAGLT